MNLIGQLYCLFYKFKKLYTKDLQKFRKFIKAVYYVLKTDIQWLIIQNIMVKVELFIRAIRHGHIRVFAVN